MTAHPDFGKNMRRAFEVHENCYDCADFYDGCQGWRASKDFECRDFNRLPDVLPGTCGQTFPPSRRQVRAQPAPIEQPAESDRQPEPEPQGPIPPAIDVPREDLPDSQPGQPDALGARLCTCGTPLPKGKRLCDCCRTENRRRTLRTYMQSYRKQRSPAAVRSDPGVPLSAQGTHATQGSGEDRGSTGQREGVPPVLATSVLQQAS